MKQTDFKQTCILYFTTGATSQKAFCSKNRKNEVIQKSLFEKTLTEVRHTQLHFLVSDGSKYGDDFSSRIKGCVQHIFHKGYENIIIIGDDAPLLQTHFLLRASKYCSENKICIGPASDGGTYLIAFGKSDFQKGILDDLPWQKADFNQQLLKNIHFAGLQHLSLPELTDIDDRRDVRMFLDRFFHNPFAKILKNLYQYAPPYIKPINLSLEIISIFSLKDRGPPTAV